MDAETGNSNISGTVTDRIEILTVNLGLSTTAARSKKVCPRDWDNDRSYVAFRQSKYFRFWWLYWHFRFKSIVVVIAWIQ